MAGLGFKDFQVGEVLTSSDVDGYLMQQTVMRFPSAAARGSALGTAAGTGVALSEGMVTYLDDTNVLSVYDGTAWRDFGYTLRETLYYTSSSTFQPAAYPWLRAIRVKAQGSGGGGGRATKTDLVSEQGANGAGGGGYAESFITNISGLGTAVTVTVGLGGTTPAATGVGGVIAPTNGSDSSFGTAVVGDGSTGTSGGTANTGDFTMRGGNGGGGKSGGAYFFGGHGGRAFLGAGGALGNGDAGGNYGGGGAGGAASNSNVPGPGGAGGNGIVIVELYA